ncbi:MAG: ParB/RepB/Spo0J family partition protein [Pseudomonadales bacterium]|nr:ParB/RepB/Spo0J family partition protein [Pseudomonadales bacterium]
MVLLSEKLSAMDKVNVKRKIKSSTFSEKENSEVGIPAVDAVNGMDNSILKKQAYKEIDPSRCRAWTYHNRSQLWLTTEKCGSLIESIRREGQQQLGLVRKLENSEEYDYEIIFGLRRWFACSSIEGRKFKARITSGDDKECARLMHLENEESQNITDFEKACAFRHQLDSKIFKSQLELSESLNVSTNLITRLMKAAKIMENEKIASLISEHALDISIRGASKVSDLLLDAKIRPSIERMAEDIVTDIRAGKIYSAEAILKALISTAEKKSTLRKEKVFLKNGKKTLVEVKRADSGRVTIIIDPKLKELRGVKAIDELKSALDLAVKEFI